MRLSGTPLALASLAKSLPACEAATSLAAPTGTSMLNAGAALRS